MIKDFRIPLTNIMGVELKTSDEKGRPSDEPALMNEQIATFLLVSDPNLDGAKKVVLFNLAEKVMGGDDETDYTVEEMAQIKESVGKNGVPLVAGQILKYIES